ncbi:MAG: agmatine deiminase family protein [Acidobacteriota bacterium]|nr:agmatine deiminase family protein [Acidobacteriota bacterium]
MASANTLRMPAEWEPHAATWIAWPHKESDWPGKLACIPWIYAEIVRWIAKGERCEILVRDVKQERTARDVLIRSNVPLSNVRFHRCPTDRVWTRDSGPIFVMREYAKRENAKRGGELVATHWKFNAWAKYPDWKKDQHLPEFVANRLGAPRLLVEHEARHVVLEGGSIDVNGRGTLLTTEECLLSRKQARNPRLSRRDLEWVFATYLGATNVIWLKRGIVGDDTHGHVDDTARFVAPRTVVAAVEYNKKDANYSALQQNLRDLKRATDQDGKRLEVVELPMPRPIVMEGQRLPASYANFYIANAAVLAPIFGDPNDRIALDSLTHLFPTRAIVPVYSRDFIWGLGAMHCMTQQQPA